MSKVNGAASRRPIVWTIAGSDSGGGAGIQADLLTMHDLGGHGCSVITCITAQNSVAVDHVEAISIEGFLAQLDTLWADLPPAAIKIGLLPGPAHIEALTHWFEARQGALPPVVLDPVLVASSGAMLNVSEAMDQFDPLFPYVALITPNGDELAALTGVAIDSPKAVVEACQRLLDRGVCAVLAKGGHFDHLHPGRCVDLLFSAGLKTLFDGPRIDTQHTHGSGCTLSSALATLLAQDYVLEDALSVVRAYLHNGLSAAVAYGAGPGPLARTGWPTRLNDFPTVPLPGSPLARAYGLNASVNMPEAPFAESEVAELGIYPVVDSVEWVERLLTLGVKTLQLRIKDRSPHIVETEIARAIELGHAHQARLFINDYWQLAIKHSAYGVHLGQEDMESADLASIQRAGLKLGLSTHGYFEILRAHALKPSYIAMGHIFPTPTKAMPSAPQGLDRLHRYVALVQPHCPAVAIGGIDEVRAIEVAKTGVGSIAVVRAVTQATDVSAALTSLQAAFDAWPTLATEVSNVA
ncbi:thiamine phosphate synthase [Ferrimonas balearica]|uniref:thiamine phosphate synthase n=1 Tax=Ferrimonas balearica TaxID=44012 RepID=UPI001C98FDE6|nr:thiamine phosphate synthase [Ferrimonas balearica]MBY5920280.1 thiamine phosphate synthase [Ferrimonas balearica]MBY5997035.1 thiamine phosphate synthase [Ferrimonas balearica]